MAKAFEPFGDESWHESFNVFLRVVPDEVDTSILISFPVNGTFLVGFYCVNGVEDVWFIEVLDNKVVDT